MEIKTARETFVKAFKDDPDFRNAYQSNIAMLIYDDQMALNENRSATPRTNLDTVEGCDSIADRLITLIFGKS